MIELAPFHRLYQGRTAKIQTANVIDVDLDLTLGVMLRRSITVEGVTAATVRGQWREATHCMVLLAGGREVLVYTDERNRGGAAIGRVYVPGIAPTNSPVPLEKPPGIDVACVEVSSWIRWVADFGFDDRRLRSALKG